MRIARLKSPRYDSANFNFENSKNVPLTRSAMVSDPLSQSTPPLGTKKQVTLSDIAQHVGVGLMTVSRALRKPELVSEPLRAKIRLVTSRRAPSSSTTSTVSPFGARW